MTIQRSWVLPFTDIRASPLPLVGGKSANLGEMTHRGFPVPPGFCLTTAAFDDFVAACPRIEALYALLDGVRGDDVAGARAAGRRVRETLLEVEIPSEIAKAVRSSATAEDLPDASSAGQQDTYLNVVGEAALIDAVRQSPDDSLHIFFSMGHQQNMTQAMSPLGMSVMRCLVPLGRDPGQIETRFMRANAGRLFMDLTLALRHPLLRKVVFGALSQFDALAPEALGKAMQRPEFQRPNSIRVPLRFLGGLARTAWQVVTALGWRDLSGGYRVVNGLIDQHIRDVQSKLDRAEVGKAKTSRGQRTVSGGMAGLPGSLWRERIRRDRHRQAALERGAAATAEGSREPRAAGIGQSSRCCEG